MREPIFVDTTLRDGEQASGVAFNRDEKLRLVAMLSGAGIKEFEIGTPAMGRTAIKEIQAITSAHFPARMIAWCRALPQEIELSRRCGIDGVHLSFPVSDKLLGVMGKDRAWVLDELKELVDRAYDKFSYVSIGAQDASRADKDFLQEFASEVIASGAKRLRLADTVGVLNPFSTQSLVSSIRSLSDDISIEFHAHNDLGMACANALVAWSSGADALSTTVNGLGERAGNAAFEEVVMAVEKSFDMSVGIDKSSFPEICGFVEQISGRKNSLSKPVVGKLALAHESGIHTRCLMRDRSSYQLIKAEDIGLREQNFKIGKHSGTAALREALEHLGVKCREDIMPRLLDEVRIWCTNNKRELAPDELVAMYNVYTV